MMDTEIKRSSRKSIAVEITTDARVIVRAPLRMPEADIQRFLEEKSDWIEKNLQKMKERKKKREEERASSPQDRLTSADLHRLADQALKVLPHKVKFYAEQIGVTYGKITIRNQKSRWGSCSGKGNLNFNCLLMLAPEEVQDYVVVHELCHRREMNHSKRFWSEVERILPDYRERRGWLKEHGESLIRRMTG